MSPPHQMGAVFYINIVVQEEEVELSHCSYHL